MNEFLENKTVKFVLGIIAVISAIIFIKKIFFRSQEDRNKDNASDSRKKDYNRIKPTFPDYVYIDYADTLETALAEGFTEDEDAVYAVFNNLKNISDVNKLIEAYGKRRIHFSTLYSTLPATIGSLFSNKEKKKLNAILATKGINYEFH